MPVYPTKIVEIQDSIVHATIFEAIQKAELCRKRAGGFKGLANARGHIRDNRAVKASGSVN